MSQFIQKNDQFFIEENAQSKRILNITLSKAVIEQFLQKIKDEGINIQHLEYTPYERQVIAAYLEEIAGHNFGDILRDIVNDRATGGFTIGLEGVSKCTDEYVIFSTAIAHLVGISNFDSMTGKYYARFTVKDTDSSDSYLRQAYRLFTLHTDGTFVSEATDWLLMMKMVEENAKGGESRLLHLDDWEELEKFSANSLGQHKFQYIAPPSKNVQEIVHRQLFFLKNNRPCICFIDQFAYPESIEEAKFLKALSQSMESDKHVIELALPVGSLVVLNNEFWLHGRAPFEKHPELNRELLRQRGRFYH
ncbi:glutarate dioxygenase GlaH [Wohlfahrtiimonas chitiniclastica]|uniref:glutarate dioxygenase GlaH n=1 Tax=Wohlfahrtiimonas chitiniclastica TaxID=400946 RepID=UPI0007B41876|nr:glutarate dioxygenase GlaH [Wohlfahrtiimonas chitiniclastica]KZS23332.1 protein CsiD [Wohlfahrtiimonas chitiniclastica]WHR55747.1 glutarate dioxygenase GlaH [Wohlfahrtiimonas chitiniclastica]